MRAIKLIPSNSQDVNGWVWDRRGGDGYLLNIKQIWEMEIETSQCDVLTFIKKAGKCLPEKHLQGINKGQLKHFSLWWADISERCWMLIYSKDTKLHEPYIYKFTAVCLLPSLECPKQNTQPSAPLTTDWMTSATVPAQTSACQETEISQSNACTAETTEMT